MIGITEKTLAEALPFTVEWDPAPRERLVEGINMLGNMPIGQPTADDLVGLILWRPDDDEPLCRWAKKSDLIAHADHFALNPGSVEALQADKPLGTVDVYAQVSRYEFVFCMPVKIVAVDPQGIN